MIFDRHWIFCCFKRGYDLALLIKSMFTVSKDLYMKYTHKEIFDVLPYMFSTYEHSLPYPQCPPFVWFDRYHIQYTPSLLCLVDKIQQDTSCKCCYFPFSSPQYCTQLKSDRFLHIEPSIKTNNLISDKKRTMDHIVYFSFSNLHSK